MNKQQFKQLVGGKFFTVEFIKKDGTVRSLNGRLGVTKGVKGTGHAMPDNIQAVKEVNRNQWRSFNLDTVIRVKTKGKTYVVDSNGQLTEE